MSTRSVHRNRWIAPGLAAVSLLALVAASAPAATLRGTITDHSNYTTGVYHVYAVQLSLNSPIAGSTIVPAPGPWTITGVPDGHFFILAWRDVNQNFVPSRGEPMGFYGVPFPSRVTVSGSNISNLTVVMDATNLGAELIGNICYSGSQRGRIWVIPHISPDFQLTSTRGTPFTMVEPGEYQNFVLDHGTYYISAFMDLNGNLLRDTGEPFGISDAVNVIVTPGVTYRNIDVCLDNQATGVEAKTWTMVKDLYR
jgi:hypothetical protein